MAKFVSNTGLTYFYNRIKTLFASKTNFDALEGRVKDLEDIGAEENIIETVKVNGTALTPDASKAVDISVPEATSDLTNDGDGSSNFATEAYVDENGGKIDVIKVNGTVQTITEKEVNIKMPKVTVGDGLDNKMARVIIHTDNNEGITFDRETNGLTYQMTGGTDAVLLASKAYTDSTFRTETQVQEAIDDALEDITGIDYQIVATLPSTGVKGVIYLVGTAAPYDEYIWLTPPGGTSYFEAIGTTDIDLSGYWSKDELEAMTTAEIDALFT